MPDDRPNIVLILADDMGFSDLGCYGSEIPTPNIDRLAGGGLRFSQMYNFARCCPSRAALLTGVNPHQAGIGHMTGGIPGFSQYQGFLRRDCVTVAQVLQASGYRTSMSGKWHVGDNPDDPGGPDASAPRKRGFDRVFGIAGGCGSYFYCDKLWNDDEVVASEGDGFYMTDAISDNAVKMIDESAALGRPFFQYVAYTAPHWPLHAPEEAVARHVGKYRKGWDALRTARHEEMKGLGILDSRWEISPRDEDVPAWDEAGNKEWEDLRMAVYAAQVEIMDAGIGRIMDRLRSLGIEENTLVMFLSDNGGCAELLREDPAAAASRKATPVPGATWTGDGRPVRVGNNPSLSPGPADTYASYDVRWANVSNAPFRRHKRWVHEGGISTPFIVRWPSRIKQPGIVHEAAQLIDITATCISVAAARYPAEHDGNSITPLEGESLLSVIEGGTWSRQQPMFWEHEGNRAVRTAQWKLVSERGTPWELYDMYVDRTELNDLSDKNHEKAAELARLYDAWAERCGVQPWERIVGPGAWLKFGMQPGGGFTMHGKHGHVVPL